MESRVNPGLRSTSDEELDRGDLVYIVGEYREKCRCWFLILTLTKSINDKEGLGLCCLEWANNEFLHLRDEGFLSNIRVCSQDWKQLLFEGWIPVSKLKCQGGQDGSKVAPVLKIP